MRVCFEAKVEQPAKQAALSRLSEDIRAILVKKAMANVSFDLKEVTEVENDQLTGKTRVVCYE